MMVRVAEAVKRIVWAPGLVVSSLWRVNLGETVDGDQNGMRRPIAWR